MARSNIEQFDEYTGQILGRLYEKFPVPVRVMASDFFDCGPISIANDEYVFTGDDAAIFQATASWLVMAGYIHTPGKKNSFLDSAVLTAKGLELLKLTPSSVVGGPSLGDKLTKAAKDESREALRAVASEILGMGVRVVGPFIGLPT